MTTKQTTTPKKELRTFKSVQPMTVRTTADGSKKIGGYAILFNSPADLGDFVEVCSSHMLDRTLRESPDEKFLFVIAQDQHIG